MNWKTTTHMGRTAILAADLTSAHTMLLNYKAPNQQREGRHNNHENDNAISGVTFLQNAEPVPGLDPMERHTNGSSVTIAICLGITRVHALQKLRGFVL